MKKIFVEDYQGHYLCAHNIVDFTDIKYSRLFAQIIFTTLREPISTEKFENLKNFDSWYDCCDWIEKFLSLMPDFKNTGGFYENSKLSTIDAIELTSNCYSHSDYEKISHINTIYNNNEDFRHLEIIFIDSNDTIVKNFSSEDAAKEWLNEHFYMM